MAKRYSGIEDTFEDILRFGVILCVRLRAEDSVVEACQAAAKGGVRVLELTLTTPGALEAIKTLKSDGSLVVGAGTVLTPDHVREVAKAGGRFVLSPAFDPDVMTEAHRLDILAIPGAATPSEILTAHRHGAKLVKIFPAEALGGPSYIRALHGPLPNVPLVPTSGPSAETLHEYMEAGAVAVGVGREIFPEAYTFETVEAAARRVRLAMQEYRDRRC